MARRAGYWVLGGATAAASALIARPDAYRWLRRAAGLAEAGTGNEQLAPAHDEAADETFDTREARLSLRARLHEAEVAVQDAGDAPDDTPAAVELAPLAVAVGAVEEAPAARKINSRPRPAREPAEPLRRNVDEARARMRSSARKAAQENGPAA